MNGNAINFIKAERALCVGQGRAPGVRQRTVREHNSGI